jgi:hypothetical protein
MGAIIALFSGIPNLNASNASQHIGSKTAPASKITVGAWKNQMEAVVDVNTELLSMGVDVRGF